MKVLHLDIERIWRGGQRQVLLLASGLVSRGVDSTLLAVPNSPLASKAEEMGVPVTKIDIRAEVDPRGIAALTKLIRRERYDILHAHSSHAHGVAAMASLLSGGPKIVVHRRVDFAPHRDILNILKYRRGADRYIAISKMVAGVLIEAGVNPEKIRVIYSAVEPMTPVEGARESVRSDLGLAPDTVLVGNVASLVDHKGHKYLIEAAKIVCRELPKARFVIVGKGELESELKRQAEDQGVKDRVLFAGFHSDVDRMMSAFDLFAMTSHMEGLCTSILDAMSLGIPVVATDAGGIPEIVEDEVNGLLARSRDPISIAECIARIITSDSDRDRLAREGRRTVAEKFGADTMVRETIRVYHEVLGRTECGPSEEQEDNKEATE